MTYIQERTSWTGDEKRRTPDSFWPPDLLTNNDRKKLNKLPVAELPRVIDGKALQALLGSR